MDNTLFSTAVMLVDKVMAAVTPEVYAKSTPCSEWDVQVLVNHLINELAWITPLVAGKTMAEVGAALDGDLIGENAKASWEKHCKLASAAMAQADPNAMAHLSYGDKTNQAYVDEVAADIIVHGWDLAQALGLDYVVDDATCVAVEAATKDIMPMAREGGYIAEAVTVNDDSSKMDKLLAVYGRSAGWK